MTSEPTREAATPVAAPAGTATATATPADDTRHDPAMRSLYRMSRTAGVGLQDYAAINVWAVVGLLLGIASALALIFADSFLPLLIPLAAIVVSIIGWVQISRSNGTQTGRLIALAGLVLALVFAGLTFAKQWRGHVAQNQARAEMEALVAQFYDASVNGKGEEAYKLFDASFRDAVAPESFNRTMTSRAKTLFGGEPITSLELGPNVLFDSGPGGQLQQASSLLIVRGEGKLPDGREKRADIQITFGRDASGEWKIRDIQNWFPAAPRPPG